MRFPIILVGAKRANYAYTMQETDRIFEQLCEQGWNARYHVFNVSHGADWSEEELAYINGHLNRWMGKPSQSALFFHGPDDRGPAWVPKPKHAQDQTRCPLCVAKGCKFDECVGS